MTVTHGQTIEWHDHCGGSTTLSVDDCATPEDARGWALALAIRSGWTPPRWWQWWRWGEQPRFTPEEVDRAKREVLS